MEQITVEKQNCCVILPCRNQEARFLHTYCGKWPLEQSTDPDYSGTRRQKAQTEFTRDWKASVHALAHKALLKTIPVSQAHFTV
jgi:hypothetical protein